MDIRQLQKDVYALSKSKGWHSSPDMDELVEQFVEEINHTTLEPDWEERRREIVRKILGCRFTSPEDKIPQMLINITGEVSEAWEEFRANKKPTETYYEIDKNGNHKPLGIPTEIADVVIRCLDTAEALGIDLEAAILEKHAYNATRDIRHGGKRA